MLLGAEVFLNNPDWIQKVKSKRVAYLGHSASVTQKGDLVLDQLLNHKDISISCILSPQHGFFGWQQANMITSENSNYQSIPVFSLYSQSTRRLTPEIKDTFDVLLIDLQDVGCRIYTYLSTLFYMIEDCEKDKTIIVLDRPNPAGRKIEGNYLDLDFKSFVGVSALPMRHGLTLGELAYWFKNVHHLKTELFVVPMESYQAEKGWPKKQTWILPSPNMPSVSCSQCYPGTVLLEGSTLSEGRGTTKPLEVFGRPNMNTRAIKSFIDQHGSQLLESCFLREHYFKPTFDKFKDEICNGFQIHLDGDWCNPDTFEVYLFMSLFLKAFHHVHPEWEWKLQPPYEYEYKKLPIDIISGNNKLRLWIEDPNSSISEWENYLTEEKYKWEKERKDFLIY